MERSLVVTQKAYIVVSDIRPDFSAGQVRVFFDNIGHITASDVKIRVDVERNFKDRPIGEPPVEWNWYFFTNLVFATMPPSSFKTGIDVPLQNFTQEDAKLIHTGKQELWLSFYIWYDNGFEKPADWDDGLDPTVARYTFRYSALPSEKWENMGLSRQEDINKRHEKEEREKNKNAEN
jgi:hypothetical protein